MISGLFGNMRGSVRALLRGAMLSYRALFTWLNPLGYLSSRIIRPVGIAIVFASVSRYYGTGVGRIMVGASLLAGASAVIFGMALAVGNERTFGTLPTWLASPQRRLGAICQRALPHIVDGFAGGLLTYFICCLLYGALPVPVPAFAGLLAVGVITTFCFGVSLCALALVIQDPFVGPNVAEIMFMVLSGTLIRVSRLPLPLREASQLVPLSHLMGMTDGYLSDGSWSWPRLLGEALTGLGWFAVGAVFVWVAAMRAAWSSAGA